jgi:hypothetical protein
MGNTLMTNYFYKQRKKARENSENNVAEGLAPGHLRFLSDERVFAHKGGNEEMVFGPISSFVFVIRYPYQLLCASIDHVNSQKSVTNAR